ncbi:Nucleolus and neural progenitor protein-like, N-terminal domain, partial [Dillenia turbinata]
AEDIEERLKSFIPQLQSEGEILERIVYKNKDQHRRCSYFRYLLKVRRDLKLLLSAHLEEILDSCFLVINGKKPKQKVHLLESLKKKKCDGGKYNFLEQLLGVTRILSEMSEPILRAAIEISILLARSFFMGFSITVLTLLGRLRVLIQQILLDVVTVFNMVSSLSQRQQSVKITQDEIECFFSPGLQVQVFREYYPRNEEVITLECVWELDKFVLHESINKNEPNCSNCDPEAAILHGAPVIQYQSTEAFLGEHDSKEANMDHGTKEGPSDKKDNETKSTVDLHGEDDSGKQVDDSGRTKDHHGKDNNGKHIDDCRMEDDIGHAQPPSKKLCTKGVMSVISDISQTPISSKSKLEPRKKVAFISVKVPSPQVASEPVLPTKETHSNIAEEAEDADWPEMHQTTQSINNDKRN